VGSGPDRAGIKVLALTGGSTGSVDVYRATLPLTYLNNSGFQCGWMPFEDAARRLMMGDYSIFEHDVVVVCRRLQHHDEDPELAGRAMDAFKASGAYVVYETDDDYTDEGREFGGTCMPYLEAADAITVTTKHLADVMERASGGKPVYVLPNCIQRDWFADTARQASKPDHLVVMLAGTPSHYDDWRVMGEAITRRKNAYPDVEFVAVGFAPDYLEGVTCYQAVPYEQYPRWLAMADILCAPLDPEDRFNLARSPIKAIEGWCAARDVGKRTGGCAMVVSDHPVYRGTVNHRNNGILVKEHTPQAWADALSLCIDDYRLRYKLQVNGWKCAAQYDISRHWQKWAQAYSNILGG
jgi:glycosyltransferase involved in cell wall biosynthesis